MLVIWGLGLAVILAALIESTAFLLEWDGFVSFGVDSVIYYGFYVYSGISHDFEIFHYKGLSIILASLALPLLQEAIVRFLPLRTLIRSKKNNK